VIYRMKYANAPKGQVDTVYGTHLSESPNGGFVYLNVLDDSGSRLEYYGEPIGFTKEQIRSVELVLDEAPAHVEFARRHFGEPIYCKGHDLFGCWMEHR
jgi:hypothetical protein